MCVSVGVCACHEDTADKSANDNIKVIGLPYAWEVSSVYHRDSASDCTVLYLLQCAQFDLNIASVVS